MVRRTEHQQACSLHSHLKEEAVAEWSAYKHGVQEEPGSSPVHCQKLTIFSHCQGHRPCCADDAVLLMEPLEVLVLHEKKRTLGLKISWPKTKVQSFGGLLDDTIQSVQVYGGDV